MSPDDGASEPGLAFSPQFSVSTLGKVCWEWRFPNHDVILSSWILDDKNPTSSHFLGLLSLP